MKEGGETKPKEASMLGWSAEKGRHIRLRCKQHAIEGDIPRARMDTQRWLHSRVYSMVDSGGGKCGCILWYILWWILGVERVVAF